VTGIVYRQLSWDSDASGSARIERALRVWRIRSCGPARRASAMTVSLTDDQASGRKGQEFWAAQLPWVGSAPPTGAATPKAPAENRSRGCARVGPSVVRTPPCRPFFPSLLFSPRSQPQVSADAAARETPHTANRVRKGRRSRPTNRKAPMASNSRIAGANWTHGLSSALGM